MSDSLRGVAINFFVWDQTLADPPKSPSKGMVKNRHLAVGISDAGWSTFRQWLEYFGHKYGKVTVAVPPHNTSQNCSNCGQKVQKSLATRTHVCHHCGFVEDRDINAAINILRLGLTTAGHAGSYATGDLPSWAIGVSLSSNGESVNVESPSLARRLRERL